MSIFTSLYRQTLGRVLSRPNIESRLEEPRSKKRKYETDETGDFLCREGNLQQTNHHTTSVITKRRRVDELNFAPIVDGEVYERTAISAPSGSLHQGQTEQASHEHNIRHTLMPPPRLVATRTNVTRKRLSLKSTDQSNIETASEYSTSTKVSQRRTSVDFLNEFESEAAHRRIAASTLPENSGLWTEKEKDLYFHIHFRGFEPLFPKHWMHDFNTFQISVFQTDDEDPCGPLITVHKHNGEFRAIRETHELFDLGKDVRDRVLATPGPKSAAIIEKAIKKYISWAFHDASVGSFSTSSKNALPIHVVNRAKAGQSAFQCIQEMKSKLHALRRRHYRSRGIRQSIENDNGGYSTPQSDSETQVVPSADSDIPVLYGINIFKSVITIFTLNSHIPSSTLSRLHNIHYQPSPAPTDLSSGISGLSPSVAESKRHRPPQSSTNDFLTEGDSASDPRVIFQFGFSDEGQDVWHAVAIAILVMHIRRDMILLQRNKNMDEIMEDVRVGIEEESIKDAGDDDPDK